MQTAATGGHGGRRDTTNFRHGGLGHFPLSNPIVHPSAERIAFRETKTARRQGRRLVATLFKCQGPHVSPRVEIEIKIHFFEWIQLESSNESCMLVS